MLTQTIIFALIGGILPAVIWLWFWLPDNDTHPEPGRLIFLTFVLGMVMVPITLIAQLFINEVFLKNTEIEFLLEKTPIFGICIVLIWASIEEVLKFLAAYTGGLRTRANKEPVDVLVYMITAALGFAALENAMFLFTPLLEGDTSTALITTNMRFIGATLVHVASSALIGVLMAFSYFFKKERKHHYVIVGVILAIALHTVFNLSIIKYQESLFKIFFVVWIAILIIIMLFEKIKNIHLNKIK